MAEISGHFGDREILDDMLASQKEMTGLYNLAAGECASGALRGVLMDLLGEEHQMQADIFTELSKRGWYPTEQAPQQKVRQALERFQNSDS